MEHAATSGPFRVQRLIKTMWKRSRQMGLRTQEGVKQETGYLWAFYTPGGGRHWPRKGVWGCAALKTPFSRLSCRSQGSHFKQKKSVHKTHFWENLEILASTASIFTQILAHKPKIWKFSAHKPPNLEIFRSQAPKFGNFPLTSPPFQRQMSVRKPHTSEIRAAHPYLKKCWVSPPPRFIPNGLRVCSLVIQKISLWRMTERSCLWFFSMGVAKYHSHCHCVDQS